MFSKILVPVDGSDASYRALDTAVVLSKKLGSKITAINVIKEVPTLYIQLQKILENEGQTILNETSERANQKGIIINVVLLQGDPTLVILNFTKKEKYDVIIMGSRCLGPFKELLLGSVSSKILHHSLCPVLLMK